jgi:DNA-binding response OmpR family regulator
VTAGAGILLVEDSATIRHVVTAALANHGLNVIATVETAREALDAARTLGPALVILNKMQPGADGDALIQLLRREPTTSHMKIMMLTEKGDRDEVLTSIRGGADDYVVKPFDPDQLARRVATLLRKAPGA